MGDAASFLSVNGRVVDFRRETLRDAAGAPIALRPQAFAVLRHLAAHPGEVVTKQELIDVVWEGVAVTDDSLVQCIHQIRRALGDEAHAVLQTVPRRGYLLEPPPTLRRRGRTAPLAALVLVLMLAAAGFALWRPGPPPHDIGIAVLPLQTDLGDPIRAGVAEALTDDVVTELSRARSLRVLARNTVAGVEGDDAIDRLRELGADYVLEGRLEQGEDRLRVAVRLVDSESHLNAWSGRFEQALDDIFAIRDPLVTEIVGTLSGYSGVIWKEWLARAERSRPRNLTAFELLIRAKAPYGRNDEAGIREARALIEEAVARDPELLIGWIFLAGTHLQEAFSDWGSRAAAWERFEAAVDRAAELDPDHGRVLMAQGLSYFRRGDADAGRAAFERALATYPNDSVILGKVGAISPIALGTEAAGNGLAILDRLAEIDPLHPPYYWFQRAYPLYYSGRYAEAAAVLRKLPHRWFEARLMLALALAQAGDAAARAEVAELLRLDPEFSAEAWIANDFYQPGSSSVALFVDGARKAGLPICTADAAAIPPARRLPDCEAERGG
ncbi:MAG TPA: winged helix-turn-helix domain-containing protein [Amaricoccus sp.]|uniref:winged helix-turn-helix domain-containing protein n=1 Tax=Amaricoccus sp. TaxID=1872485 RepID=UPI002B535243|nr:winged helix-turn-helix domain-containing protein [Amaricoccus sp.]HMQ91730.1 winged helix-turn-helix domain-containing protein [Amaricoccus sp.]HMR52558.1 winged helix-turn-helix domain-containing protein [Amaricoccus sp.]HMR59283.1 winged helix-turn-helix domain-containing protein [Amaricoccus sp.]HMT99572.1 winged helix-turn-helix domain-containing protein [Amaricoccus sp.]